MQQQHFVNIFMKFAEIHPRERKDIRVFFFLFDLVERGKNTEQQMLLSNETLLMRATLSSFAIRSSTLFSV